VPKDAADIRAKIDGTLADSPQIKGLVEQALASAQGDLKAAQAHIEAWYDNAMDRVSSWYKRRSQFILFFIGSAALSSSTSTPSPSPAP